MRVLYLGSFAEYWNTENQISNALERVGCKVVKLEESTATHQSIVAAAVEHSPDVFLFAKARFKGANAGWPEDAKPICAMLSEIKQHVGKVVCWVFDLMCDEFSSGRFQWSQLVAADCDLFVMTDGYTAPKIPNSLVVRQGVPDDVDHDCEWDVEKRWDVLFLGTPYRERGALCDALNRTFGPRFKHENNTRGPELTRLIRSCKICVGPQYPYFAGYWSNRLYVVAGHGGLFAAPPVEGMLQEGWRSGDNFLSLPVAPDAMAAKLNEYVTRNDASQLETIRKRGYELANSRFTYDERVRQLLAAIAVEPDEPTELDVEPQSDGPEEQPETDLMPQDDPAPAAGPELEAA